MLPRVAVVLHCGAAGRDHLVREHHERGLLHVKHVLASDRTVAKLGTVAFPDSPGKLGEDWVGYKK